jgi:hypothetical protein
LQIEFINRIRKGGVESCGNARFCNVSLACRVTRSRVFMVLRSALHSYWHTISL